MTLRIAIAKPDWGFTGGFELLTQELSRRLESAGHEVRWMSPKVADLDPRPFGLDGANAARHAPEFFRYVQLIDRFRALDLHRADLVISAQPPSYSVDHPRHLALFSHHLRCYYDLSDVMVEAGLVGDVDVHRHAEQLVRTIDARYLNDVPLILATSEEVQQRLDRYNGLRHTVGVFHAGLGFRDAFPDPSGDDAYEHVLCVSRHEFPKRTELFVAAMNLIRDAPAISVGQGGRLGYVMQLDRRFAASPDDAQGDSRPFWCTDAPWIDPTQSTGEPGAVQFTGFVEAAELDRLYRRAVCVVAPALLEDYGLTAIEAMAYGKPLVVCSDGGNLVNFVEHGVNGLIVEPQGGAIAAAVQTLVDDRAYAERLGHAAREIAREFTWDRAMHEFEAGLEMVLAA